MARMLAVLAAVAALSLAAVSAAAGSPERRTAGPQWLVFTADPPGIAVEQLFRITTDGKQLKQLTRGEYSSHAPAFSPDGKRIAFAQLGAGIFTIDIEGKNLRQLTTNGRDNYPTWSPDGKTIVFLRPGTQWDLWSMSGTGAGQAKLKDSPPAGRPTWTKRGLVVASDGDLVQVDPKTGKVIKSFNALIDPTVGNDTTAVSPDLTTATFEGARADDPGDKDCGEGMPCPRYALWILDLRTEGDPKLLSKDVGPASWSPDGKTLAYVAQNKIFLRTVATGTITKLTPGRTHPTSSTPPAWQPR